MAQPPTRQESPLLRFLSSALDITRAVNDSKCIGCGEADAAPNAQLCAGCAEDAAKAGARVVAKTAERGLESFFTDLLSGKRHE